MKKEKHTEANYKTIIIFLIEINSTAGKYNKKKVSDLKSWPK
jgi:hypothetical protein